MASLIKRQLIFMVLVTASLSVLAQNSVPMGIHYQAVARDNYGNELVNKKISVKFSVISGDPLAAPVYQEVHQDITTSKFGVFSLVIGHGVPSLTPPCTSLSQIAWDQANHYLKVEVKFENDFMDMGTMQFLAVPYALYAQKSLEPGPEGPRGDKGEKGEPGDPATDNQTLSFDGSNLTISGTSSIVNLTPLLQTLQVSNDGTGGYNLSLTRGNTINLATIEKDGDPTNEIQDLSYNNTTRELSLLKSSASAINLTELKNDADADPANEIQSLTFNSTENKLYLTNSAPADLTSLKNDADADPANEIQDLSYNSTTHELSLLKSSAPAINLTGLKNDADADPANEIQDLKLEGNTLKITNKIDATLINLQPYLDNTDNQTLTYTESTKTLTLDRGGSVSLGTTVAFRAKNSTPDAAPIAQNKIMTYDQPIYYEESYFNPSSGIFTAPLDGIYTFNFSYYADGSGDGRELAIFVNETLYEKLALSIAAGSTIPVRSVTMRLSATNQVTIVVYTGLATQTGTGTFSGFKVY